MDVLTMKTHTSHHPPEAQELLRRAAELGPGHRGVRKDAGAASRKHLAAKLASAGIEPPPFLGTSQTWIERGAKLFEAGEYPDKGLSVTSSDLVRLQESFDLPVPILIEHAHSPLQLGYLTDVRAQGSELFGTVALTKEANDLLEASGARSLSIGLESDLSAIQELSLVANPRIASAKLFHGEVLAPPTDLQERCQRLEAELHDRESEAALTSMVDQGQLLPAQVPFAKALLGVPGVVSFDGASVPVRQLAMSLLQAGRPHGLLAEHAPGGRAPADLAPDERAFYDRYFSGLSLEEIAKNR